MNGPVAESTEPRLAAQRLHAAVRRAASLLGRASVIPILIPLWILFTLQSPAFATARNVRALLAASAVVTVAATGETLVLLTAGIDLSVATVVSCSAVLAATVMGPEGNPLIGLLIALLVGLIFGLVNGCAVGWLDLTPFVLTLGTHLVARGIAFSVSEGIAVRAPPVLGDFGRTDLLAGVPAIALVAIAVLIIFGYLLSNTTWGRYVYLLGSNEEAARYVGVRRRLVKASVYVITGVLGGLAGFLSLANLGVALPGVGDTILLTIIGGVILGGTSLFGGEGSMWRTALGVLLLATLTNGLNLLGFPFYDQLVAQGLVILAGTGMIVRLGRGSQRG
jgi:ribose/xylose/arabinose/galactoside ABC-type transport system permease subunit